MKPFKFTITAFAVPVELSKSDLDVVVLEQEPKNLILIVLTAATFEEHNGIETYYMCILRGKRIDAQNLGDVNAFWSTNLSHSHCCPCFFDFFLNQT